MFLFKNPKESANLIYNRLFHEWNRMHSKQMELSFTLLILYSINVLYVLSIHVSFYVQ